MTQTETISLTDATDLMFRAFMASGVSNKNAISVSKALVAAEAEGQVGHGFSRFSDYVAQVKSGKVDGSAQPFLESTRSAALMIDAANGFAYPALDVAIEAGVNAAQDLGATTLGIRRSHHCGALSVQVARIAERGCVGLMVANAPAAIAPWGANTPVFGTNPIALAAPRQGHAPLVIDLSLSRVARGKIMHAKKAGKAIPEGWALDKNGQPTTDPDQALEGTMIAAGDAKGTALALMVEILAAAIPGANFSTEISSYFSPAGPPTGAGQFLLILRPADLHGFVARLERLLALIEGLDGARLPGQRRAAALRNAQMQGLSVPKIYLDAVRTIALGTSG